MYRPFSTPRRMKYVVSCSLVVAVVIVAALLVILHPKTAAPPLSATAQNSNDSLQSNAGDLPVKAASATALGSTLNSGGSSKGSAARLQGQASIQQRAGSPQDPYLPNDYLPGSPGQSTVASPTPAASSALIGEFTIRNTGSTNTQGWTLHISADGSGYVTNGDDPTRAKTYGPGYFDVATLAAKISAVGAMSALQPSSPLMKSVSFGTSEYATYQGSTSGDLEADYSGKSSAQQQLHSYLQNLINAAAISALPSIRPLNATRPLY